MAVLRIGHNQTSRMKLAHKQSAFLYLFQCLLPYIYYYNQSWYMWGTGFLQTHRPITVKRTLKPVKRLFKNVQWQHWNALQAGHKMNSKERGMAASWKHPDFPNSSRSNIWRLVNGYVILWENLLIRIFYYYLMSIGILAHSRVETLSDLGGEYAH